MISACFTRLLPTTSHSRFPPPFLKGGNPIFEFFKKGGEPKKKFWGGGKKGGEMFSKLKGGYPTFKLNLGIEKNNNGDF